MRGELNRTSGRYWHGLDAHAAAVDAGPHGTFGAAGLHDAHGGREVGAADRALGAGFPRAGIGGRWGSVGTRRRDLDLQEQRGLVTVVTQVRRRGGGLSRDPQISLHFRLDAVRRREGSAVRAFQSVGRLRVIGRAGLVCVMPHIVRCACQWVVAGVGARRRCRENAASHFELGKRLRLRPWRREKKGPATPRRHRGRRRTRCRT